MRMSTDQPAHRAYDSRYSGKRPRGRPRRRWSDSVADTLKGHNKSLCEASHLAVQRRLHLPATPDGTSGRKNKQTNKHKPVDKLIGSKEVKQLSLMRFWSSCLGMQVVYKS
ncbi:hypothetical protein ElyMa_003183900 [Elysia marginata]|uniref:Uncharacterized protein n=1 Tax=Elysia marginata TaxID=1093978 RepID=A0AAV4J209_9GAST|nr:hypothetical protein ElyMa_003183900 [Elysia marginata]